jgi:hypothetical protein
LILDKKSKNEKIKNKKLKMNTFKDIRDRYEIQFNGDEYYEIEKDIISIFNSAKISQEIVDKCNLLVSKSAPAQYV